MGLPDLASCEHKLHFRDLHSEYLTIFEDQITEFIVEEGYTIQDFFKECKEVMDDFGCALFEEHEDKWFVEAVIQAVDYQGWFAMMVETAGGMKLPFRSFSLDTVHTSNPVLTFTSLLLTYLRYARLAAAGGRK